MPSPLAFLLTSIPDFAFRIVPEREEELRSLLVGLGASFHETQESGFIFRADPDTKRISYSVYAIELLWAISCTAWLYYERREKGDADTEDESSPPGKAVAMLRWILTARRNNPTSTWPTSLPAPVPDPPYASTLHVANELTAVSIAWILHHEISHLKLGHTVFIPPDLRKQQEMDADHEATEFILPGAEGRVELSRRALGIVIATLAIVALDLNRHSFASDTHPESYKRVIATLDTVHLVEEHDAVRHVACIMLKLLMHIFSIEEPSVSYERPMDCLLDLAFILCRLNW
jgi:hypothetical protein